MQREEKDWRQLFKQNWEEVEKVVELETAEEKVELEIDTKEEVVSIRMRDPPYSYKETPAFTFKFISKLV